MAFVGYLTIFSCFLQLPEGERGECFDGGVPDHLRRFDHASRVRICSPLLYLGFIFVSRSPSLSRHLGVIPTVSVTRLNMH